MKSSKARGRRRPPEVAVGPASASPAAPAAPRGYWVGLILVLACWWGALAVRPGGLVYLGIRHFGVWFIDSFAILASNDALAQGLDVYAPNPLDYFGRPHVYSDWWLGLGRLGLTRADNLWLGLAIGLGFLVVALGRMRPRSWGEMFWYLAILGSPPILLAVERANNDLVIFLLLTPVVPCLRSAGRVGQGVAILLIAVAAGLKFYPAAAGLVLLASGPPRTVRWRVAAGLLALAAVAVSVAPGYLRVQHLLPPVDGLMNFGSIHALTRLGLGGAVVGAGLGVAALGAAAWWRADAFRGWEIPAPARDAWLSFVLGAVVLCGCFLSTNYAYRWIFALWLAPWLWWVAREAGAPPAVRRLAGVTMPLLGAALWIEPLMFGVVMRHPGPAVERIANSVYVLAQPLVWALMLCLLGFLTEFVRSGWRAVAAAGN